MTGTKTKAALALAPPLSEQIFEGQRNGHQDTPGAGEGPEAGREPYYLTDVGNGRRLADAHREDIHYCYSWNQWLAWDGKRWARDQEGRVEILAKSVIGDMRLEATRETDAAARDALWKWATRSEAAERVRAAISMARSEPGIPILPSKLDRDPWALNLLNGTLDLRTGELRPHRREDLITKLAPVAYDIQAQCPTFMAFMDRIFSGNAAIITFMQRALGYSLTGDVSEQSLFFLDGAGANGKTTLLNCFLGLLGDYGCRAAPDLLLERRHEPHPTERADLAGVRFVATIEAGQGKHLAETLVKDLTGGDRQKARRMREDFFEFEPTAKIFLAANHKPLIRGQDHAMWRRIKLVPFNVTIPDGEHDKKLPEKLRAEWPGILRWAVEGCLAWQRDGLGAPQEISEATAAYRQEQDRLSPFLDARCDVWEGGVCSAKDLYAAWESWAEGAGEKPGSQRSLATMLHERGFTQVERRDHSKPVEWRGIALAAAGQPRHETA